MIRDWFAFDEEIESVDRWVRHSNQHPILAFYRPLVAAAFASTVSGFIHPMLTFITTLPAHYIASRIGERTVQWHVESSSGSA